MTKQLQFYERIAPISAQRHLNWCIDKRPDYAYASHSNAVPLMAAEFGAAALAYTIVFLSNEEGPTPVVLLGLNSEENLYLEDGHCWKARYIPAFVRRYPFVFSRSEDGNIYTLCIDEGFEGCNQEGRGEALFDVSGAGSDYLNDTMQFVTSYQQQIARTNAYCEKLQELELLEEMTATFQLPSGDKAQVNGFLAVDQEKLRRLPGNTLQELASNGFLELIYAHLLSMRNFAELLELRTHQRSSDSSF
jgi:SapC